MLNAYENSFRGSMMASFIGSYEDFIKFIGPRTRNVVNSISRKHKSEINKCEHCGKENIPFEAAHVKGRERPVIIKEITSEFEHNGVITIDLENFENLFIKTHYPLHNSILVLCTACHRQYDSSNEAHQTIDFTEAAEIETSTDNLPSNAQITDYFRNCAPGFTDEIIKNLQSTDYCRDIFGVHYAVLKEVPSNATPVEIRELVRLNGYPRWSSQRPIERGDKKYLVTTQWFQQNRQPFVNWCLTISA